MTEKNTDIKKAPSIEFLQYHLPKVKAGLYRVEVAQTVTVPWDAETEAAFQNKGVDFKTIPEDAEKKPKTHIQQIFASENSFSIRGERTVLNPQEVLSVFPPPGSSGDHSNVLPHVVLRRSTLPWERESEREYEYRPWLAVLLFDEDEAPKPQTVTLQELYDQIPLDREPEEHDKDKVTVIDVPSADLKKIVPTGAELALLAHARKWKEKDGNDAGNERSVVIGNRLPRRGRTSIAHLVSMEYRYTSGQFNFTAKEEDTVRLVSLKNWRFHCLDEKSFMVTESVLKKLGDKGFSKIATDLLSKALLNKEIVGEKAFLSRPEVEKLVKGTQEKKNHLLQAALYKKLGFKSLLLELSRDQFRLPPVRANSEKNAPGEAYRKRSYVPLPHHLRNGQKTISWYHSPLISGHNNKEELRLPARAADELVLLNQASGMYDVSYATAWEIGRMIMLQSKKTSIALYQWKRSHAAIAKDIRTRIDHLPFTPMNVPDMPETVKTFFEDLAVLKPLPFNYLVPDERMLPKESLRFFCVDKLWVECLIDGAFSIGRVSKHQAKRDSAHRNSNVIPKSTHPVVSGILIRSDVVAGWPDLQVDGYAASHPDLKTEPSSEKLPVLRMERLSTNVLICLFSGDSEVNTVDIHQKPEGLHFGLSEPDALHFEGKSYFKLLRNVDTGDELEKPVEVSFDFHQDKTPKPYPLLRKVYIAKLAKSLNTLDSATFALQMIEGVQKVRFTTGG